MSAAAVAAPVKAAKTKKTTTKPKKVADHPKYADMVKDALTNLKVLLASSDVGFVCKSYIFFNF